MVTTKKPPRRRAASSGAQRVEKLVERMRQGFIDGQDAAMDFLAEQGWTDLKFGSCYTFWSARMSDVDVTMPVIKHAAYAMFDEGFSARKVSGAIKGLGAATAAALKRQKDNGLDADSASMNAAAASPGRGKGDGLRPRLVVFQVDRTEYDTEWVPKVKFLSTSAAAKSVSDALGAFALETTRAALAKINPPTNSTPRRAASRKK